MTSRHDLVRRAIYGPCDFPRCPCAEKLAFWNAEYDRVVVHRAPDPALTPEQWADVLVSITTMLHCLAAHCPDRKVRAQATVQLLHPIYQDAFADD